MILVESPQAGVTVITLNRPEKRNALCRELLRALNDALRRVTKERVVILQGAGPVFCAGLDLAESLDPSSNEESAALIAEALILLYELPGVTIASVHGASFAGGAGLMSVCDIIIASEETKVGYPEVRRGLVAALVMTILKRQVRDHDLRELLLLGEDIDAKEAYRMGLINRVVPESKRHEEVMKCVKSVMLGAPEAIATTKKILDELGGVTVRASIDAMREHHRSMRETPEGIEGKKAFLEKRLPSWA